MKTAAALMMILFGTFCFALAGATQERMPARVQMVLTKASAKMKKEQYDQVIDILTEFRSRAGGNDASVYEHPQINLMLGNSCFLAGEFEKAKAAYQRVIDREQENIQAWQNLGRCEYELGNFEASSRCLIKAYELTRPARADFLYQAAVAMLMAEKNSQAVKLFQRLLKKHPHDISLQWKENLVYALLAVDQNRQALSHIIELAEKNEGRKQRQWREILLQQYLVLAQYPQAEDLAMQLTRLEPDEPIWWKSLAYIHLQQNKLQHALQSLIIYRFLKPLSPEEKKLIADLHLQLGIPVKAVSDYETYIDDNPDQTVMNRLVHAYLELGENEMALKRLEQFDPEEIRPDLCMVKGYILYDMKRYQDAETAFECAAQSKVKRAAGQALLLLAYCRWQQQQLPESLDAFKKAAEYEVIKPEAKKAMTQLEKIISGQNSRQYNPGN